MGLNLVSEDTAREHQLKKLGIFHHIAMLLLLMGIIAGYQKLDKRLKSLEKNVE